MVEIALKNGRISNFQGLVTLTLDRVILHTVMHHTSTSTYMPNFVKIEETFCAQTHTHVRTFENHFIRSTHKSRPKNCCSQGQTNTQMFHDKSWKPIYFLAKRSKVKVTSHKKQWQRGCLHSCECWLVLFSFSPVQLEGLVDRTPGTHS